MAATAAMPQPAMAPSYDNPPHPSSLTARRPAATNLPSMIELPMPPFGNQPIAKPVPVTNMNPTATAQANVGNLLTPPSTVPGDGLSPLSSIMGSSAGGAVQPPSNMSAWLPPPPSVTTPLGMSSGTGNTPNSWTNSIGGMFSPSILSSLPGHGASPTGRTTGVPPPPFISSLPPPFSASGSFSAPATLPAIGAQQQQPMQYPVQQQTTTNPQAATMSAGSDQYGHRPQTSPTNYISTTQPQSAFPPYNVNSPPIQQSPMSAPLMNHRLSPSTPQGSNYNPNASSPYGYRAQMSPYSLPSLNGGPQSAPLSGPVLTNMHTQNNQMNMVNMPGHALAGPALQAGYPMTSSQAAHMFGTQQQQPPNERPFKCDQCPQSFNRNHDLKRHKRIHLAVKPFPCLHCDKSFSRKDALKRHILVKGCGKGHKEERRHRHESPDAKSESSEDSLMSSGPKN